MKIMQTWVDSPFFLDTWIGQQNHKVPPSVALPIQHYLQSGIVQPKSKMNVVSSQHLCSASLCSVMKNDYTT